MTSVKICTKCGIEKEESEFAKAKHHKDGLASQCKKCKYQYDKNRATSIERKESIHKYRKNSEKYKKYKRDYQKSESYLAKRRDKKKEKRELYIISDEYTTKLQEKRIKKEEGRKLAVIKYNSSEKGKVNRQYNSTKKELKKQIGAIPPPELVEVKLLIIKTKRLCKTLKIYEQS